ncbi:hypothetical protein GOQ30_14885 [Flavobacterium sp. TP390]|uniref:Lipocalin-like domain-containing protein n=1 Tax=Flavobacterium profundi TaxID=1774945 RepID=A0A6I4IUZ4_9FLAO|nr:lipocalin family protein [Flavobacterium profundi]MVO10458.1 hypothetical protein [Flavobacterium profundi]
MKKIVLIVLFTLSSLLFYSCSKNEEVIEVSDFSLEGTWELVEIYRDSGNGVSTWDSVDEGYEYTFFADGSFQSNRFTSCFSGNYTLLGDELKLIYDCPGFNTQLGNTEDTFIETISWEANTIILVPTYLDCTEGCGWKFKKTIIP